MPWNEAETEIASEVAGKVRPLLSQITFSVAWLSFFLTTASAAPASKPITWKQCLRQPSDWYASDEARRIADNVLLYQQDTGGWPKNVDMAAPLNADRRAALLRRKSRREDSTIDNGATTTQLWFLARVYEARPQEQFKESFVRGLDFLLGAQYENGGWPQFPHRDGYYRHITFNDNALVNVLSLLRELARGEPPFTFVEEARRTQAAHAMQRGIECILKCQVRVDGRRTVWCAQHEVRTLRPAAARSYELESLSGAESVGVVRFLMGLERPGDEVKEAIEAAIAWFESTKLTGLKVVQRPDPALAKGYDKVVVRDPQASPLWARFYEIGTNRPFFCGRDGVKKDTLAEIEYERRVGYGWYTDAPATLLAKDYPAWRRRIGP